MYFGSVNLRLSCTGCNPVEGSENQSTRYSYALSAQVSCCYWWPFTSGWNEKSFFIAACAIETDNPQPQKLSSENILRDRNDLLCTLFCGFIIACDSNSVVAVFWAGRQKFPLTYTGKIDFLVRALRLRLFCSKSQSASSTLLMF